VGYPTERRCGGREEPVVRPHDNVPWVLVRLVAALLVTLLLSCGAPQHPKLADRADGKGVIRDAMDGRLDRNWSCSSLRAAVARLPDDMGALQRTPVMIEAAAGRACDAALAQVERGLTRAEVTALLGPPDRTPRCWFYSWPPDPASAVDGVRLCFAGDSVSFVQTAEHG
jgi:hypothetical protein